MYFNVNFNVFFKLTKVHFLVSELYINRLYLRVWNFNLLKKKCMFVM